MTPNGIRWMKEAARLTRSGDLKAATATIRRALHAASVMAPMTTASSTVADADDTDVIDAVAREVVATPPPHEPAPPDGAIPNTRHARPAAGHASIDHDRRDTVLSGRFDHPAGQRDYKLYVPPAAGEHALPLVVMLHGCKQDADDFAHGTAMNEAARTQGFFVLYPEQSQRMNAQRCWNWFKHNHQQRERGEPALLAALTQAIVSDWGVDRSRVYVAGLSAGGAMAAILGRTHPDLFAAIGVHSGLAAGAAANLPSAIAAMKQGGNGGSGPASGMPTIVFHGDGDTIVHPRNGEQVLVDSIGADASAQLRTVPETATGATRRATRRVHRDAAGKTHSEIWTVHGAPHAWSGGRAAGSFTDPSGPDATAEMLRFFFEHRGPAAPR